MLPGSENAVRLAMTTADRPRARPRRAAIAQSTTRMRPIRDTISARRSAPRSSTRTSRAHRARPNAYRLDRRARSRARRTDVVVASVDVPPFARAAMDGYAVRAEDTFGASRARTGAPALRRAGLHRPDAAQDGRQPGDCAEIATGAPMPEGADAVVMVEETGRGRRTTCAIFTPVVSAAERRPPGRGHRSGQTRAARRRRADAEPRRRARRARTAPTSRFTRDRASRSSRPATRSSRRASRSRRARSTTSTASRWPRSSSEHGGVAVPLPHRPRTRIEDLSRAHRRVPRGRRAGVLRRQLGRRARSDSRRHRGARRGALSRHRGQTGQADGVRARRRQAVLRHARLPHLVPDERLHRCWCRRCAAIARLPPHRAAHRDGAARRAASCRRPDGTSSTRCGSRTARPCPRSRRPGDITSMSQADGYIEIPAHTDIVEKGEMVEVKLF